MYTEAWGTEVLRAFLYLGLPVAWGRGCQWKCASISRPRDVGPARPERSPLLWDRRAPRLKERFSYFGVSRI